MVSTNYKKIEKLIILSYLIGNKFDKFDDVIEKYKEKEYKKLIKKDKEIWRRYEKIYRKLNKKEKMKIDDYRINHFYNKNNKLID